MGQEGLYVLVLLGLLMVASEGKNRVGTRCWVKGKEVTLLPNQCPAEFDGADARFCCRLCYGANCCQPRRARVNLRRCPREAQYYTAAPDLTTAPPSADQDLTTEPDLTTALPPAPPPRNVDWGYVVCLSLILIIIVIAVSWWFFKNFWKSGGPVWEEIVEEETRDLPHPYPGLPVVLFRRSPSHGQDDTVVISPQLVAPPQEAASASAPGEVLPREAVTGRASELTGLPEAAADGSASKTEDLLDGGAPDPTE